MVDPYRAARQMERFLYDVLSSSSISERSTLEDKYQIIATINHGRDGSVSVKLVDNLEKTVEDSS